MGTKAKMYFVAEHHVKGLFVLELDAFIWDFDKLRQADLNSNPGSTIWDKILHTQ